MIQHYLSTVKTQYFILASAIWLVHKGGGNAACGIYLLVNILCYVTGLGMTTRYISLAADDQRREPRHDCICVLSRIRVNQTEYGIIHSSVRGQQLAL